MTLLASCHLPQFLSQLLVAADNTSLCLYVIESLRAFKASMKIGNSDGGIYIPLALWVFVDDILHCSCAFEK